MRGGDLFDIHLRTDGSAAILIADVSSKGAPSIIHTDMLRRAFRMCAMTERSPASIMSILNRLRFDVPQPPYMDATFASAVIVAIERGTMICRYASAGHDIGLFVNGTGHRHLAPTGPVLGVMTEVVYRERIEAFGRHDFLLLGTDGFTECRKNRAGAKQFGTAGIVRSIEDEVRRSCSSISHAVGRSADIFTAGHYRDDATLAVIARTDV
jgi:serine phosphatase RsbU (regulator of sigma subunit)